MATETTKIPYVEGAAPSTPAANRVVTYAKSDGLMYSKDDAGVETLMSGGAGGGGGGAWNAVCNGRLTLTTAVPVTTADVTAATSVYFTPYRGNQIGTYSGSAWTVSTFTEKTLSLAGLTANSNYDIFIVDSTLALEALIWTNATTRATAIVLQDGVYVKSGATTRRYLGTIRITGSTGQCEDSVAHRFVFNYYNPLTRLLQIFDATNSWTYAVAAWRQANATATDHQVDYVCGVSEQPVRAQVNGMVNVANSSSAGAVGIGIDSTSANSAQYFADSAIEIGPNPTRAEYRGLPGVGYHYIAWLEYARQGTLTFYGDENVADTQSGIVAEVWG